ALAKPLVQNVLRKAQERNLSFGRNLNDSEATNKGLLDDMEILKTKQNNSEYRQDSHFYIVDDLKLKSSSDNVKEIQTPNPEVCSSISMPISSKQQNAISVLFPPGPKSKAHLFSIKSFSSRNNSENYNLSIIEIDVLLGSCAFYPRSSFESVKGSFDNKLPEIIKGYLLIAMSTLRKRNKPFYGKFNETVAIRTIQWMAMFKEKHSAGSTSGFSLLSIHENEQPQNLVNSWGPSVMFLSLQSFEQALYPVDHNAEYLLGISHMGFSLQGMSMAAMYHNDDIIIEEHPSHWPERDKITKLLTHPQSVQL
ncbi:LOW QUALITY PROTEIN: Serine/threonine-protein kinase MRCK beta, partial [Galemys pyrenaicus]